MFTKLFKKKKPTFQQVQETEVIFGAIKNAYENTVSRIDQLKEKITKKERSHSQITQSVQSNENRQIMIQQELISLQQESNEITLLLESLREEQHESAELISSWKNELAELEDYLPQSEKRLQSVEDDYFTALNQYNKSSEVKASLPILDEFLPLMSSLESRNHDYFERVETYIRYDLPMDSRSYYRFEYETVSKTFSLSHESFNKQSILLFDSYDNKRYLIYDNESFSIDSIQDIIARGMQTIEFWNQRQANLA